MNVAYLCLGGNIGNRESSINEALEQINQSVGEITSFSGIYETEAWGVTNQQPYLNMCIGMKTEYRSHELLKTLMHIEKNLGRERNMYHTYEPRTIDIDILFYNNEIIHQNDLTVPHPRLHLRKFVLVPLNEIAPNHLHPVLNKTIFNLLNECLDTSKVKPHKKA